jgi:hypothetical protein
MTRFLVLTLLTLIALIILTVALNAPRVAEANAHTAAATAMQAQANVTGLAVFGMACLATTLGLVIMAGIGLFLWLTLYASFLDHPEPNNRDDSCSSSAYCHRLRVPGRDRNRSLYPA